MPAGQSQPFKAINSTEVAALVYSEIVTFTCQTCYWFVYHFKVIFHELVVLYTCPNGVSACPTTCSARRRLILASVSAKQTGHKRRVLARLVMLCFQCLRKHFWLLVASWPAHRPEAKSQGTGPRTGQELNTHTKRKRKRAPRVQRDEE